MKGRRSSRRRQFLSLSSSGEKGTAMALSSEQKERYKRNIMLPGVGDKGQLTLLESSVLIVGVGGLGSPAALYLAAAGVGRVGIIDGDRVDISNLQRQILHSTGDIGHRKTESAAERMRAINPDVEVWTCSSNLSVDNAVAIVGDYDFVIESTDNFKGKFLVADACHLAQRAYSHAGITEFSGQTMTVIPGKTACYRCVFQEPPPPSFVTGVMGVTPGVIGTIQATEAIKFLLGIGELLTDRLFVYDSLSLRPRTVPVERDRRCRLCGDLPTITKLKE